MTQFISVFAGAGGLDLGLEQAGWDCLYATDWDAPAVRTLQLNGGEGAAKGRLSKARLEQRDIRELDAAEVLAGVGRRPGDIDLLAGGPPCQSWSSAGHQLGFADPRGRLFEDYLRLAKGLDVRWLLFENVRGLVTARDQNGVPGGALTAIRQALFAAGWQSRVELLNAADYGAPQRRVRLILIGYRLGDEPPLPAQTHAATATDGLAPWVTLGEALSALSPLSDDEIIRPSGKLAIELEGIAPGSGVKSPGKREATRPGGHWGYKQGAFIADLNRPARTVTASAQQDWIRDPALGLRRLSPRECAALQTFPADWRFSGSRVDQYRQIGNAVPPILAMKVGAALRAHVQGLQPEAVPGRTAELAPLPGKIAAAVQYTAREEARNGESRRQAAPRRTSNLALT